MMQPLPGFRDFLPEDCATRNYVFAKWREIARRYGFAEWDGPVLEPTELYKKKSGDEIVGQLFNFIDKGERQVALRPELTPTLARVVAAHEREFKKPLKWFSIGQFFRYEKQQRGRLREHYQLNCDIVGEVSPSADAELIALCIDILRSFGLTAANFVVRISSRTAWESFLQQKRGLQGYTSAEFQHLLNVVDKMERQPEAITNEQLAKIQVSADEVRHWIAEWNQRIFETDSVKGNTALALLHTTLHDYLVPRGLLDYVSVDFGIVRGLTYYTDIVFEAFDRSGKLRALAGGGRYDGLIGQLSDGAVKMPALGFAMGDVVLGELIKETPGAREKMRGALDVGSKVDIYVVIAKEERRGDALADIQALRDRHHRVEYPLTATKVAKQFQAAEDAGAMAVILYGDEWPQVRIKEMQKRKETLLAHDELLDNVWRFLGFSGPTQ
jgi:histidyl-tRNA synthetase